MEGLSAQILELSCMGLIVRSTSDKLFNFGYVL